MLFCWPFTEFKGIQLRTRTQKHYWIRQALISYHRAECITSLMYKTNQLISVHIILLILMYNFCLQFEFKLLSFAHSIPFYFHFIFRFCHKFVFVTNSFLSQIPFRGPNIGIPFFCSKYILLKSLFESYKKGRFMVTSFFAATQYPK